MDKHTPGPWKAGHMILMGSDGLRKKDMWGVSSDYMVKDKNDEGTEYEYGYAICDVIPTDWRLLPEADAKLIAAAPELLEACKRIVAAPFGVALGDLEVLKAAVAKAEGTKE